MTGSKTNSSSCKLNITGKAVGGRPRAGGEEAFPPRLLPTPAGTEGAPDPGAAGQPGLRPLFPLSERGALTLRCLQPPGSPLGPGAPPPPPGAGVGVMGGFNLGSGGPVPLRPGSVFLIGRGKFLVLSLPLCPEAAR